MNKHLHIISLNVPYPVLHGGMFDIFYKIVALHEAGICIHLHCFSDQVSANKELNKYCKTVDYYPRKKGLKGVSLTMPYIVSSRKDKDLTRRLMADDHPILLEGIHCTRILKDKRFSSRKIILRLHNIEFLYYRQLYKAGYSSFANRLYYLAESILLKKYESEIANKVSYIYAVSKSDKYIYEKRFELNNVGFLPVFAGYNTTVIIPGKGTYCLYHGNLSVPENMKAAYWLIKEVFSFINIPLIIAGRNPGKSFVEKINGIPNISIYPDPSPEQMLDLLQNAQCHVLPSFNNTGVKFKLINALFNGRHCIINTAGVKGSGLEDFCHITDESNTFKEHVVELFNVPFTSDDINKRDSALKAIFDKKKNAEILIRKLW